MLYANPLGRRVPSPLKISQNVHKKAINERAVRVWCFAQCACFPHHTTVYFCLPVVLNHCNAGD